MFDVETLLQTALDCGATKAMVIPAAQLVTNKVFAEICAQNSCGSYGKYWVCPPALGEAEDLIASLQQYTKGVLYQTIGEIEDSFDIEGMGEVGAAHKQLSHKLHDMLGSIMGDTPYLHLSSGGCDLCTKCTRPENLPCRFPEKALGSMEGYCIDVYNTVKGTELKYINGENTVTYFGIVLFKEA